MEEKGKKMNEEILKNYKNNINVDELLNENIDINDYIKSEYNRIMLEWQKKYYMFDIPSGMISIKINDEVYYVNVGGTKYDENTIFDIASITKFYTEFILFEVLEDYKLNINTKIGDISKNYNNIKDLSIMDLISFNNTYRTIGDTRDCQSKQEALKVLRTSYILKEKEGYYLYTDLPIMILTDILEEYTGLTYKDLFNKYIIKKYDLNDTYIENNFDADRYVSNNKRFVNDPKANIMGGYYGHAGVKTTSKDFIKFFSQAFDSKYNYLFTTESNTLNGDGSKCTKKALMGNSNLFVEGDSKIPSQYLPKCGFAVQGSVRSHAETMIFDIEGKKYTITSSIFLDLYTQIDSIKKYEEITGNKILKYYNVNNNKLILSDIREVLDYSDYYKEIVDLVGKSRIIVLNNYINKEINKQRVK